MLGWISWPSRLPTLSEGKNLNYRGDLSPPITMDPNIQDWETVTLRSKNPSIAGKQTASVPRKSTEAIRLAKLDRDEVVKSKVLSSQSRKDLIAARLALKKSQTDIDRQCMFPANTLREIEAGRATPTGAILNRLNRELKVSLRLE